MAVRAGAEPASAATPRVVLVTGASRGIGQAAAQALADAGCRLMLTARGLRDLEGSAMALRSQGHAVRWEAVDLCEPCSADALVDATVSAYGRIDALVCCAGALHVTSLSRASDAQLRDSLELNLVAPMRLSRAAIRAMTAGGGGRIVFVASTFAFVSAPNYSLYTVAKAGLVGLARSLAVELAGDNIQVNAIAPGQVRTGMIGAAIERFGEDRIAAPIPAGRIAEPHEIGTSVRHLVCDAPSFLTGDVMVIDGGYLCR